MSDNDEIIFGDEATNAALAQMDSIASETAAPSKAEPAKTEPATEPNPPAPAPATPPAAAPEPDKASARQERREVLAKLHNVAKAEAAIRKQQRALAEQEAQVKAERAKLDELNGFRKTDPIEFMRRAGLDPDKLTDDIVAGKAKPPDPLQAKLAELEGKLAEQTKAADERQARERTDRVQRNLAADREQLVGFVVEHADAFPFAAALDHGELGQSIQAMRRDHYLEHRSVLDAGVAAGMLNASLQKLYQQLHSVAQKQTGAATSKATHPPQAAGEGRSSAPTTIAASTHRATTSQTPDDDDMSESALLKAAIAAVPD